jgi:WD40 repeat protein
MVDAGSHWLMATMRPQHDPIGVLARALVRAGVLAEPDLPEIAAVEIAETTLRRSSLGLVEIARLGRLAPHENVLVLVDQFEEIFRFADLARQHGTEDDAKAFVKLLLAAAQQTEVPLNIVVTMRSDFLGDCDRFPGLPEAVTNSPYLTPRLSRDELQAAITGPVGVRGGRIAPALIQQLLNDVGDDRDQLPILQHALMRTWEHWQEHGPEGRPMEPADLEAIGGMAQALSRHADEAYASLAGERQRTIAERVFKCLTEKGPDNRELRRPTPLKELAAIAGADPEKVVAVIDVFRAPDRAFLMPPYDVELDPSSVVDISHESLIRQWTRLRRWVEEEAESVAQYRRLAESALLYRRGSSGLLSDPELSLMRAWRAREQPGEPWARRYDPDFERTLGFLEESEEKERRRHLLRVGLVVVGVLLVGLLAGLTFWAVKAQIKASSNSKAANVQALDGTALGLIGVDPQLSLLLALQAADKQDTRQAETVLRTALLASRLRQVEDLNALVCPPAGPTTCSGRALAIQRLPGSKPVRLAVVTDAGIARLDVAGADGGDDSITPAKHAPVERPRGTYVGGGGGFGLYWVEGTRELDLVDLADGSITGRVLHPVPTYAHVTVAAYNAPTGRLAFTDGKSDVTVVRLDRGAIDLNERKGRGAVTLVQPLTATCPRGAQHPGRQSAEVTSLAFGPNGGLLASGGNQALVAVWTLGKGDAEPAACREVVQGYAVGVAQSVAFSQDAAFLAAAATDGTTRVYNVSGPVPKQVAEMLGHTGEVEDVAFSPEPGDGGRIVTASVDGTARVWKNNTGAQLAMLAGHLAPTTAAVFVDGMFAVTGSADQTVRLWYVPAVSRLKPAPARRSRVAAAGAVNELAVSPDRQTIVSTLPNGAASIQDTQTGGRRDLPLRNGAAVTAAAFSPDGALVVTGDEGGSAAVWKVKDGTLVERLDGHTLRVASAAFSPDGKEVVTASDDKTARVWNLADGSLMHTLVGHFGPLVDAAFSPDGQWVVTTTRLGVDLWSVTSSAPTLSPQVLLSLPSAADVPSAGQDSLSSAVFDPAGTEIDVSDVKGQTWTYACSVCETKKALMAIAEHRLEAAGITDPLTDACENWVSERLVKTVQPIGSSASPCGEL